VQKSRILQRLSGGRSLKMPLEPFPFLPTAMSSCILPKKGDLLFNALKVSGAPNGNIRPLRPTPGNPVVLESGPNALESSKT
jgi:hypothetical protein